MSGCFELRFAAFDAVLYGGDRRPVDDHHVAFVVQAVANVFTGQLARTGVIGGDGGVGLRRRRQPPPPRSRPLWPASPPGQCLRIGGVEDDHIDFGGDKVIDLRHLLAQIVAAGDQRHFDVIPASLRASSSAPLVICTKNGLARSPTVTPIAFSSLADAKGRRPAARQHTAR